MLGGQSPTGRWWTYNTPMDGVKKASAHDIVFQARAGSPELNCCSVNAPRGLSMVADWALMRGADSLYLNFYGPGIIETFLPAGGTLTLTQSTDYPLHGKVAIQIGLSQSSHFTLNLRIPTWSQQSNVAVNGAPIPAVTSGRYLALSRTWRDGDRIEIELDMSLHFWFGERECEGKASLYRGPILLAYDQRYNQLDPAEIPTLDLRRLSYEEASWSQPLAPWLLLRFRGQDRSELLLCDFANAGIVGTEYRSWLPVAEKFVAASTRHSPAWTMRIPGE
jgi:DUF1680 family protein